MRIEGDRQGSLRTNLPGIAEYKSFNPSPLDDVFPINLESEAVANLATCARKDWGAGGHVAIFAQRRQVSDYVHTQGSTSFFPD